MSASNAATSIQVLSRMFSLLDTLAQEGNAMPLKTISERTGLHPSTAHRILNDLAVGNIVERSGPGSYRLGLRLITLGNRVKSRLDLKELATRPMQELHRMTGHTVSLYIRQENDALCVGRTVHERNGIQISQTQGQRLPLTASAGGKVLLLNEGSVMLQSIAQAQGFRADVLQADLSRIRQTGWAQDGDEDEATSQHAAAPIFDDQGHVVGSLGLHVSIAMLKPEWSEVLCSKAQLISNSLGWSAN